MKLIYSIAVTTILMSICHASEKPEEQQPPSPKLSTQRAPERTIIEPGTILRITIDSDGKKTVKLIPPKKG